jgi:hypothetical protein
MNGDGSVCKSELFDCMVAAENQWRETNAPGYGAAYCPNPFPACICEGAWSCEQIDGIAIEVIAYYDSNGDYSINPQDDIEDSHYEVLVEYCDFNNDGTIDACEVHACIVICENEWRDANCPGYGYAYCPCPWVIPDCEGSWNCADIIVVTDEVMMTFDTNNDG